MKKGSTVELIKDSAFYKKGQRAIVVCECDPVNGNGKKMAVRYEGEEYFGEDVDVVPKHLFIEVS